MRVLRLCGFLVFVMLGNCFVFPAHHLSMIAPNARRGGQNAEASLVLQH